MQTPELTNNAEFPPPTSTRPFVKGAPDGPALSAAVQRDLLKYMNKPDTKDPWGEEYIMLCGDKKPAAARGCLGVVSKGNDRKENTEDDVNSWDE